MPILYRYSLIGLCLTLLVACGDNANTNATSTTGDDTTPTADADNDGVADAADACDNTPTGQAVDSIGCPVGPDADNDGVPDVSDQCPDTPSDYPVNAAGCSWRVCHEAVSAAAAQCVSTVGDEVGSCYSSTDAACADDNTIITMALADMQTAVTAGCPTVDLIRDAGYGPLITRDALDAQLESTCRGEPASMAARSLGGPHAYILNNGTPADGVCVNTTYEQGMTVLNGVYADYAACVLDPDCDNSGLADDTQAHIQQAQTTLTAVCPAMAETMGSTAEVFLQRAADQAHCMVAAGHGNTATVDLSCGPNNVLLNDLTITLDSIDGEVIDGVDAIPRGQPLYIELDSDAWGTLCGRGAEYGFVMRLATQDDHLSRAVMSQAGGGVCFNNVNCGGPNNASMQASTETSTRMTGIRSTREENPFREWTALFQPYCTQDLHIGGGGVETDRNGNSIFRYGAINLRASMRIYRDLIWRLLKNRTERGYLPEDSEIIFTGTSAGGYGVQYNMHYPLDELRWQNTLSIPDAAFVIGGGTLDTSALFTAFGDLWQTRAYQPPYCLDDACATTVVNHPRHAERLGAVPFQKLLNVSSQHDMAQENTQGYPGPRTPEPPPPGFERKDWIDRLRAEYCDIRGTPNLFFHLGANTASRHGYLGKNTAYDHNTRPTRELLVDGVSPLRLVADMVFYPGSGIDRVEEGPTLPDVQPFPCDVTNPPNFDGDFDDDGIINQIDVCAEPGTAANGCPILADDADADGATTGFLGPTGQADKCLATPFGEIADEFGCSITERDTDFDGVVDANDDCPGTADDTVVDNRGC